MSDCDNVSLQLHVTDMERVDCGSVGEHRVKVDEVVMTDNAEAQVTDGNGSADGRFADNSDNGEEVSGMVNSVGHEEGTSRSFPAGKL